MPASLWIATTVVAAGTQTLRNALQRGLTTTLGTIGATHVRFLFGLPFALLFLIAVLWVTGERPVPGAAFWGFATLGGLGQITATAAMLSAMRDRSFLVAIAYTKTEPVQVALFGLVFLGEWPSLVGAIAIVVATCGVMLLSRPKAATPVGEEAAGGALRPALFGIAAGGFFALSAVFFKGAILASGTTHSVAAASTALAGSLFVQTLVLTLWLFFRDRRVLVEICRAWRPSLGAGFCGALASQLWFVGFALAPVASVRTLGLVEIFFTHAFSRSVMKEKPSGRDLVGVGLVVLGVIGVLQG
jgi:drug/metabolite transporter (DMT)-like permease